MSMTFTRVTAKCPFCEIRKHQIDMSEERAKQVVADALDRHVSEAHPERAEESAESRSA